MKFSLFQNLLPLVLSFGSVSLLLTHYVSAAVQPTCYWEYLDHVDSAGNDGPCAVVNASSVSGFASCWGYHGLNRLTQTLRAPSRAAVQAMFVWEIIFAMAWGAHIYMALDVRISSQASSRISRMDL